MNEAETRACCSWWTVCLLRDSINDGCMTPFRVEQIATTLEDSQDGGP